MKTRILIFIILAQFSSTSIWFAGNSVISELRGAFDLNESVLSNLTSSVQFGFIIGTLCYAIFAISDKFSPSKVFFISALLAAIFNLGITLEGHSLMSLLVLRFFTGFFLAGIYPIGMKIAADHFEKGLGRSLGFLVGALVLGTALPHLLKQITSYVSWQSVFYITSSLAGTGGLLIRFLVPDGPFRTQSKGIKPAAFISVFKNTEFRSAAFGYFGHMWELYTFWAFVPVMIHTYNAVNPSHQINVSISSFSVIAIGSIACFISGVISEKIGLKNTAKYALALSGICCLISPWVLGSSFGLLFLIFLHVWGIVVIADSPLFSTLVAQAAPKELKGTALTIVNCIGFSITIVSIQVVDVIRQNYISNWSYMILALGPMLGVLSIYKKAKQLQTNK